MTLHKPSHPLVWAFILLVVSVTIIGLSTSNFRNPFYWEYSLSGPSSITYGNDGRYYIVDGGYKKIVILDANYRIERILHGEKKEKGFYYASQVSAGADGTMYVADRMYSGVGTIIGKERILKYSATGKFMGTIFEKSYATDVGPMQYGNIYSMSVDGDTLTIGMKQEDTHSIQRITMDLKTYEITRKDYVLEESVRLSDVTMDVHSDSLYYTTRLGALISLSGNGTETTLVAGGNGLPWHVDVDRETRNVYYTDLEQKKVYQVDQLGRSQEIYRGKEPIYDLQVNNQVLTMTDYSSVYIYKNDEVTELYTIDDQPGWAVVMLFLWVVVGCVAAIILLIAGLRRIQNILNKNVVQRGILIVVVALITTVLVTYLAFSSMFVVTNRDLIKDLNLYGDVLIAAMDTQELKTMNSVEAYESQPFMEMKEALNSITDASYDNGLYYYYIVYKRYNDTIVGVMDYEDTMTSRHPFFSWGDNDYTAVIKEQETIQVENEVSSYGTWSYVLKPIIEEDGTGIGIMEVGISTDELVQSQRRLLLEIIVTILCAIVVMIIIMMEVVFYKMHQEINRHVGLRVFPLRTLIFISFLADSMQDAFIPILIAGRYNPDWIIPAHIGIALPITMQLFMTALFSFVGGFLSSHVGIKKTLVYGFGIQLIGYVVAGITTDYVGILVAKSIVGMGMGLIIVGVNTLAAMADEKESGRLFGEVNAGILAGVTAGVGIGSVLLSRVGYREVYLTAALMILLGCVVSLFGENQKVELQKHIPVSIKGFFLHREIWPFLVLLLMPFLIALSYREYFFPLYAESMGMSESGIGYLYLLSGLIVIYAGPTITHYTIQWLGEKGAVLMATGLMAAASLVFGIMGSLLSAVIGIFILSFAISFGYAAQATYYASRDVTKQYGEGNAMSVYSLFDNGGQTVGPLLYASALVLGYGIGALVIGIGLLVCMGFFVMSQQKKVKKRASN